MIRYLHVRMWDDETGITSHGGVTVAYTVTLTDICMALALCNEKDRFNYQVGRLIASNRLSSPKYEVVVIPLKHPITYTIVEWLEQNICDTPIEIYKGPNAHWVSTFIGEEVIEFEPDWVPNTDEISEYDCGIR